MLTIYMKLLYINLKYRLVRPNQDGWLLKLLLQWLKRLYTFLGPFKIVGAHNCFEKIVALVCHSNHERFNVVTCPISLWISFSTSFNLQNRWDFICICLNAIFYMIMTPKNFQSTVPKTHFSRLYFILWCQVPSNTRCKSFTWSFASVLFTNHIINLSLYHIANLILKHFTQHPLISGPCIF